MNQLTFRDIEQIALTTEGSEKKESLSLEHYKEWREKCKEIRQWAFTHALRHPGMAAHPSFLTVQRSFHLPYVTWQIRFVLHAWPAPEEPAFWEGSVTLLTEYPGTEKEAVKYIGEYRAPDEGTPFFLNWTKEQKEEGRRMLDDVFGDIIRYRDDVQRVFVHEGSTHLLMKVIYQPDYLYWLYDELTKKRDV